MNKQKHNPRRKHSYVLGEQQPTATLEAPQRRKFAKNRYDYSISHTKQGGLNGFSAWLSGAIHAIAFRDRAEIMQTGCTDGLWSYSYRRALTETVENIARITFLLRHQHHQEFPLVPFEHHLVPGPGRQAPETSRCHPSLDDWSGVVLMSRG